MELKFAVVREDPAIEAALVRRLDARSVLTVASGGCTILSLATDLPEVAVTAFDLSPVQLAHVTAKAAALSRGDAAALNVGDPNPYGLNQHGAFEKLFRVLRTYVSELVVAPGELDRYFAEPLGAPALARSWLASRYWPAAFETAFNEPFLHAMFGPDATQHAEPGSYPGYFRRAFERGLLRDDGPENPFLAHVFLGEYRGRAVPDYLRGLGAVHPAPALVQGGLEQVPALERFDLFSLSNIFDWSDDALVARWGRLLSQTARPGAAVLLRQLNNRRDLRRWFPAFRFDDDLGQELLARDRSLFYEKIRGGLPRAMIRIEHVRAEELGRWAEGLRALERDISYPIADGADAFRIDHGPSYHPFFSTLGEAHFLLALDGERVVGSICGILRRAEHAGRSFVTGYACDYKVAKEHRGAGVAVRLLLFGLGEILSPWSPSSYRSFKYLYGAAMRGERGDVTRSTRGRFHPMRLVAPVARLAMYFVAPAALAALDPTGAPPPPAVAGLDLSPDVVALAEGPGIVSTRGRKDFVLRSTGLPWTLVHVPLGPAAWTPTLGAYLRRAGEALVARGEPGPACFALDVRLADHLGWLSSRGLEPGASTTIVAGRAPFPGGESVPPLESYPFIHLATSEI